MIYFLTSPGKLTFSHTSGCSRCYWNFFEDDESFGSYRLSWKMNMENISCWSVENGKPKNIHGFWSQVHKHWYGKANKTSFRGWPWTVSVADRIGIVKERLSTLTWRLHDDLSSEVFDDGTKELIKNCRVICDLKSLLVKIYQIGSVIVELEKAKCSEKYHWKCCCIIECLWLT